MAVAELFHTIDSTGRIAISDEAQAELSLVPGTRLREVVVGGMLVYVPPEVDVERAYELDLERAVEAFQRQLAERGITADDLIADIERHKDETFRAFYPDAE